MTAPILTFAQPHPFPGKLIIVEGIDGSGKSTQLLLLQKWLEAQELKVFFTEWNSSALVRETTRREKKQKPHADDLQSAPRDRLRQPYVS